VGCVKGFEVIVLGNIVAASGYRKGEGGGVENFAVGLFSGRCGAILEILL
jgi:hypothetical protein